MALPNTGSPKDRREGAKAVAGTRIEQYCTFAVRDNQASLAFLSRHQHFAFVEERHDPAPNPAQPQWHRGVRYCNRLSALFTNSSIKKRASTSLAITLIADEGPHPDVLAEIRRGSGSLQTRSRAKSYWRSCSAGDEGVKPLRQA